MTSPTERPRDRIYSFCLDRLASLSARATIECKEPTCGARATEDTEDYKKGELTSCDSPNCGEKRMLEGWRRELQVMRDIKALVEGLERVELEREKKRQEEEHKRRKRT